MQRRVHLMVKNGQALRPLVIVLAILLSLGLSACGSVLQSSQTALSTWWLSPPDPPANASGAHQGTLNVQVTVIPGLDTDRVLSLSTDAQLVPVAGARWAEFTPDLLTSLTVRSLESATAFSQVTAAQKVPEDGCLLTLELREFWFSTTAQQQPQAARMAMVGHMECHPQKPHRRLAAQANRPVSSTSQAQLTAAMQSSLDEVMSQLVQQLQGS